MLVCEYKYCKFTDHQGDSDMLNNNIDILKCIVVYTYAISFFRAMPPAVDQHVTESKLEEPTEGPEHVTETGSQFPVLNHLTQLSSVTGNINFTWKQAPYTLPVIYISDNGQEVPYDFHIQPF
jgi:hypothetical protein